MNKLQQKIQLIVLHIIFISSVFSGFLNISFAQEYVSADFRITDSSYEYGGGYSVSDDYSLESALGDINTSTSSVTSYNLSPNFLYYPIVTIPIVSTTPGHDQISLSWTAAVGDLGWVVSGYNVGISTVSGGPYTFSSLGNVLSSTRTGLVNGVAYYFIIRVEDAFGNIVATSTQVSAVPVESTTPPSGGGGGGGGFVPPVITPPILPVATTTLVILPIPFYPKICEQYIIRSIKLGAVNDPSEVKKLQTFLRDYEGFNNLAVTGFYDQTTYNAVKTFQTKYASDILTPVGLTVPSGYVYNLTIKKINEIYCQKTDAVIIAPVTPPVQLGYSFDRNLTLGATGDDVTALQRILVSGGYMTMPTGVAYGYFGSLTKTSLIKYQLAKGITPASGYFGPITRQNLSSVTAMPVTPIVPVSITPKTCSSYITRSIKLGAVNDPSEVKKLQTFLRDYEGFNNLAVTGFYDQTTYNAVKTFQTKYASDILTPVGLTVPSGYVYNLTIKKINEIYCQIGTITPSITMTTVSKTCTPYITRSIKLGAVNDPSEVKKLQTFLRDYEGFNNLAVTGFYDQTTYNAVKTFQTKYASDILTPVGLTVPSGYVYNLTIKKINEFMCN